LTFTLFSSRYLLSKKSSINIPWLVALFPQVLAGCLFPQLLKENTLPLDVRLRARRLLEACDGGSVGEDLREAFSIQSVQLLKKTTDINLND